MRYRADLLPTMRIMHGAIRYDIAGVLPDKDSGLEYVTIPVVQVLSGSEDPPLHIVLDGGQL